jgi:hypothetical protein
MYARFFIIVKLTKVDKNHKSMQGISTPAGNHGNAPRVPAAVGSLASSRVSGLSNSLSLAIASQDRIVHCGF